MRTFGRISLFAATVLGAVAATVGVAGATSAHPAPAAARPATVIPHAAPACTASDCVIYDLSTQSACSEVTAGATFDSRWTTGLGSRVDETILGGHIIAYKIQYFNGTWSGWFVPGVNDIDIKFNPGANTERRQWSYFYDHTHDYVICQ